MLILTFAIVGCIGGFIQVQKLSHSFQKPYELDKLLSSVTIFGVYIYAIFSLIASGVRLPTMDTKTIVVFVQNCLLLLQVSFQGNWTALSFSHAYATKTCCIIMNIL